MAVGRLYTIAKVKAPFTIARLGIRGFGESGTRHAGLSAYPDESLRNEAGSPVSRPRLPEDPHEKGPLIERAFSYLI